MKITLPSGRIIGEDQPIFIIAEVGSNWRSLDDCLLSIRAAKACGADAVKFQLFTDEALYGFTVNHIADVLTKIEGVAPGRLPISWLPHLKAESDRVGIEFMCSAFSPKLIEAVDPFVNIHKLASAEMCHVRMLEKLADLGKPVFMSTGGHGVSDIARALAVLTTCTDNTCNHDQCNADQMDIVVLYCVSAYPAQEVNCECVAHLRNRFDTLVGFSDHTLDLFHAPYLAQHHGASVLEKHFCAIDSDSPDRGHSLKPDQFKRMVDYLRQDHEPHLAYQPEEKEMILRHNRRLIATNLIRPGDTLKEGINFDICRSLKDDTHAYSPFLVNEVNGRVAKREIQAGNGIGPGDV